jgi:gingipain R
LVVLLVLALWAVAARGQVRVVSREPGTVTLACEVGTVAWEPVSLGGDRYSVFSAAGLALLKREGAPELPWVSARVPVVPGARLSLRVLETESRLLAGCPPPAPSRGFVERDGPGRDRVPGEVYRGTDPFPGRLVGLGDPLSLRRRSAVPVAFYPFQFDPVSGEVRVHTRIVVEVRVDAVERPTPVPDRNARRAPADFQRLVERRWLDAVPDLGGVTDEVDETGSGVERLPADEPERAGEADAQILLIVGPEHLLAGMDSFIQWKRRRGLDVRTAVYPDDTGSGSTALTAYFQGVYDDLGVSYVILVGDNEDIPCRVYSTTPTDTMYTLVAGDDYYHDMFLSRISARTEDAVRRQAGRFVAYERNPSLVPADWQARALCVASDEGTTNGAFGMVDYEILHLEAEKLLAGGYTLVDELYDPGVTSTQVLQSLAQGRGLVYYLGHGLVDRWVTSAFDVADAALLSNGQAWPFIISAACHTGNFSYTRGTCLSEAVMSAGSSTTSAGAVGMVAATTSMDWDPPIVMERAVTDLVLGGEVRTLGGIWAGSVQEAMDWCYDPSTPSAASAAQKIMVQTHLFGDCSLELRTAVPQLAVVAHAPTLEPGQAFPVLVTVAGIPLADATVSLADSVSVLDLARTDAAGEALLSVGNPGAEVLTLTVYHAGIVPVEHAVPVAAGALRIWSTHELPTAFVSEPYAFLHRAAGGTPPYLWSVMTAQPLPEWLALDPFTGTVSGIPTESGTFSYGVEVRDQAGSDPVSQSVTVTAGRAVSLTGGSLQPATAGVPYQTRLTADGDFPPFAFTVVGGSLPQGMVLESDGRLQGTPTTVGTSVFDVLVADQALRQDTARFEVNVSDSVVLDWGGGWTCGALGFVPADGRAEQVFPHSTGVVWVWDAVAGGYRRSEQVEPLRAYWFYCEGDPAPYTLVRTQEDPGSIDLEAGWNLVGAPLAGAPVPSGPGVAGVVWQVNPTGRGAVEAGTMEPFHAYWIYATEATTLTVR